MQPSLCPLSNPWGRATSVKKVPAQDASSSQPPTTRHPRTPVYFHIAAWSVPLLVLGQFSMLAIIPLAALVIATLADARVRALHWWTGLLAVLYLTPLAIWLVRPDGAASLSKDMHPVFIVLIVLAGAALLAKIYTRKRLAR